MIRKWLLLSLAIIILPAIAANAATIDTSTAPTTETKPLKVGVIDVRTVVQKSPQLQAIDAGLTSKFKPREQKIVEAQAAYKAEQDKLEKNGAALSDNERTKLEHQIISDRANLQAMITSFQQDLDNEQNKAMQGLLSQIASIVNDIAKTENYDLILQGDSVPYMKDQYNITTKVLQQLSAKS